ncbi:MAG: hypothetical protein ACQEXV_11640 [Bacillota bacterium]
MNKQEARELTAEQINTLDNWVDTILPFARHALKQLLQHEDFDVSAKRELSR